MIVKSVNFSGAGGISRFEARAHTAAAPESEFTTWIDIHKTIEPPQAVGDPFLAAFLLPTMHLGEELHIQAPVSTKLRRAMASIQEIFHGWHPTILQEISVHTPNQVTPQAAPGPRGLANFFSGGLDSWHSLLSHRGEVAALLTVKGFDIPLNDQTIWGELVAANRRIAAEFGVELIVVETNMRNCLDPTIAPLGKTYGGDFWGCYLHGAFLAAVGHCLQSHFSKVIIASTWSTARAKPWGSHPQLDPLWSTGMTDFLHDGADSERLDKLREVVKLPTALRYLRVCPSYTPGRYNCCACEKCWRTMLGLRLLGALEQSSAFDRPLHLPSVIKTLRVPPRRESWYRDMQAEAAARGDAEMIRFFRILLGEQFCFAREWPRWRDQGRRLGAAAYKWSSIPRHLRSVRKRWNRIQGRTA